MIMQFTPVEQQPHIAPVEQQRYITPFEQQRYITPVEQQPYITPVEPQWYIPVAITTALSTALFFNGIGTGGVGSLDNICARATGYQLPSVRIRQIEQSNANANSDQVSETILALGLSVSEFARCMGVSREAVYNWKSGQPLSVPNSERFASIVQVAAKLAALAPSTRKELLRRKFGGRSFIDAAGAGQDLDEFAGKLLKVAAIEQKQREIAYAGAGFRARPDKYTTRIAAPHLDEQG